MLLELKMKNVYSFRNEVLFTMLASNTKVKSRYSDNFLSICGYDILKTSVIVGENAGGKSNFIKGVNYFKNMFKQTNEEPKTQVDTIFNEHLLVDLSDEAKVKMSDLLQEFSILLTFNNKLVYHYELKISNFGIEYEKLSFTDDKAHVFKTVFECQASYDEFASNHIRKVSLKIAENSKIRDIVIKQLNSGLSKGLIINSLSLLGVKHTSEFLKEIDKISVQKNMLDIPVGPYYQINNELLKQHTDIMKTVEFLDIFKMVDTSIVGIEIDDDFILTKSLVYREQVDGKISKRPIAFDSTGVKNFLIMSIIIYNVVYRNIIYFNDEMDSTFNPILTSKVIAYIHSFESSGQFIFTTHNIFNLTFQIFMKEQMYIVEKNKDFLESTMYSLAGFTDLRYDINEKIYEFYMKGVLGGVGNAK